MLAQASTASSAGSSVELWSRWPAIGPMTCAGGGLYETVDVGVEAAEGRRDLLDLVVGGGGVVGEVVQGHEVAAHGVGVAPAAAHRTRASAPTGRGTTRRVGSVSF